MTRQDLARQLGISASMVSRLAKRGMPTDSLERAEKWRRRHLEPGRIKGMRADTMSTAAGLADVSKASPRAGDATSAASLQLVRELGLLAHEALDRQAFDLVAPRLRKAMAAVPHHERERVELSLEVWDALTVDAVPLGGSGPATPCSDLPDDFMGTFWYQIALADLSDASLVAKKA
jgi:hypothetical protein